MSVSIRPILRQIDRHAVRELIAHFAPEIAARVPWDDPSEDAYGEALETALDAGGEGAIEARAFLRFAEALCDESGRAAIRSVVAEKPHLLAEFDAAPDTGAAAIMLRLADEAMFELAVAAYEADRRFDDGRGGWSGFVLDGGSPPWPLGEPARAAFRGDAIAYLAANEGGGQIEVEWIERILRNRSDGSDQRVLQATLFVELPAESRLRFAGKQLERSVVQDVVRGALIYDPKERTVSVTMRGGKKTQDAIAERFRIHALGGGSSYVAMPRRLVHLQSLLRPAALRPSPSGEVEAIRVLHLVLAAGTTDSGLITIRRGRQGSFGDVYATVEDWRARSCLLERLDARVVAAKIRFFLPAVSERKARTITVVLSTPHRNDTYKLNDADRTIAMNELEANGLLSSLPDAGDASGD